MSTFQKDSMNYELSSSYYTSAFFNIFIANSRYFKHEQNMSQIETTSLFGTVFTPPILSFLSKIDDDSILSKLYTYSPTGHHNIPEQTQLIYQSIAGS